MWVFLNNAMLSIVQDKDNPHFLMVRARLRGHIREVFPRAEVIETPHADYRWRARIEREDVMNAMMAEVLGINYTNFKKSVRSNSLHSDYLRVWGVMLDAQEYQKHIERGAHNPGFGTQRDQGPRRLSHLLDLEPRDLDALSRCDSPAARPRSSRR